MFFKTSGYKPRSGSSSSTFSSASKDDSKSASNTNTNANTNTNTETSGPAVHSGAAGRRRSSQLAEKFGGLEATKRSSQDERRANWADQKPGTPGILGGLWNTFTKGT